MSQQGIIIGLAAAGVLALGLGFSGCSFYNTAVSLENGVEAQYRDNQGEYDSMWKKVVETARVPSQYKDDFKEVLAADNASRYGAGGSGAAFQWLTEHEVPFDATLYRQVQQVIEAGRNDFQRGQRQLADKQRAYKNHVQGAGGKFWTSTLFSFPRDVRGADAPSTDLDGDGRVTVLDYPIVTSDRTRGAFDTGVDDAIDAFADGRSK